MKAVRATSGPPSFFGPLLLAHVGNFFSVFFGHLSTETRPVSSSDRELDPLLFGFRAACIQRCQVRSRFSNQIRTWLTFFSSTDFRARLRAHLSSATSIVGCRICQCPTHAHACKKPTILSVAKFLMRSAPLKYNNFVHQPRRQEFTDPARLQRFFCLCQNSVTSWTTQPVARLAEIAGLFRSRVNEDVDNELGAVRHVADNERYVMGMMVPV